MRYFILFAYNGTGYHGSQTQPNGETVQNTMEEAFATILRQPVSLTFAGRTDAGVHAEYMVAHFDFEGTLPANLASRLNNLLPLSIAVRSISPVPELAHARFDATSRTYRYRITTRKDPFTTQTRTRVSPGLDYEAMNRAAVYLIGLQDCSSFCRAHTDVKTMICHIKEAYWEVENEYEATFVITADRFLRNMVRAVVGTLFLIGRGVIPEEQFRDIIDARDRCRAGQSAPAEGLFLTNITYPNNIYHEN
jgi:tRNA pseudouridine38-40 synthase